MDRVGPTEDFPKNVLGVVDRVGITDELTWGRVQVQSAEQRRIAAFASARFFTVTTDSLLRRKPMRLLLFANESGSCFYGNIVV